MIIALEGVEGTGKSTLAEYLKMGLPAGRGGRRWRSYRALRQGDKWKPGEMEEWREAGVPANTFVEDVFALDLARKVGLDCLILDRSLPSGIVYDDTMWMANGALSPRAMKLLHWWSGGMSDSSGLVVHLTGDLAWFKDELMEQQGRDIPMEALERREERFNQCFNVCEVAGVTVARCDTSVMDVETVASHIGVKYAGGWQQPLPGSVGWASWT